MSDFPSPSENDLRRRVRDLESTAWACGQRYRVAAAELDKVRADNARLRRAMRVLASLLPARERQALKDAMNG